jgi:hypothetical protein
LLCYALIAAEWASSSEELQYGKEFSSHDARKNSSNPMIRHVQKMYYTARFFFRSNHAPPTTVGRCGGTVAHERVGNALPLLGDG